MRCVVEMRFEMDSAKMARAVAGALKPEDGEYVLTKVEGRDLLARAEADGPKPLMHTMDDYLACVSVAVKAASNR